MNTPVRILLFPAVAFCAFLVLAFSASAQDETYRVTFVAQLTPDSIPVEEGLEWRVFGPKIGADGQLPLLANATGGSRSFNMSAGEYLVHTAYGHASAIRKIEVNADSNEEYFILNAGGMELSAVAGDDTPIPDNLLRFDIYEDQADERGERKLIASRALPGQIIPFQQGTYHVVSQYGTLNAEVRADIRVTAGKLTKARLKHRAARITLKLVRTTGGDALADTQWSVLNVSGDLITESTSAFPRMVLSEGVYTAIAKNGDRIFSQDFEVRPGVNQDVEVLTGA
ncbi:hypothetical protein [Salaquimonas pukyongi]|uniref:hypothetical protein n=1 Tax=Salaquimonas pukyongi TaxID=2712698 RepID=UPI00096B96F3|nr:hypothetical protein [Salaquimonas pukyongi]